MFLIALTQLMQEINSTHRMHTRATQGLHYYYNKPRQLTSSVAPGAAGDRAIRPKYTSLRCARAAFACLERPLLAPTRRPFVSDLQLPNCVVPQVALLCIPSFGGSTPRVRQTTLVLVITSNLSEKINQAPECIHCL